MENKIDIYIQLIENNKVDKKDVVFQKLVEAVRFLIEYDVDKLFQVLYRIDVNELKVKNAFYYSTNPVEDIAQLIYERQLQKIEIRKKYS